jgi:hypothetical protein
MARRPAGGARASPLQALRTLGPTEVSLPELSRISGLEAAGEESGALPGEGAVAIEALVRLLGLRRAGRPQAGQRLEAEVVEDLDLAAQLDDDQQSRLTGALRRSRRLAPAPALSSLGRRGSRVGVTRIGVEEPPSGRLATADADRIQAAAS